MITFCPGSGEMAWILAYLLLPKEKVAPDMVNVSSLDGQLGVSWKKGENAVWYEVYYTDQANALVHVHVELAAGALLVLLPVVHPVAGHVGQLIPFQRHLAVPSSFPSP